MSSDVLRFVGVLLLTAVTSGCVFDEKLDDTYGRRGASVNGTGVLAEMFDAAGHNVSHWRFMTPSLAEADTIVWVPDDFHPPHDDAQRWIDDWLRAESDRTLIYVGRDFDAAPLYWRKAKPLAPQNLKTEFEIRAQEAESAAGGWRPVKLERTAWPTFFELDDEADPTDVTTLAGPWAEGIDASQAEITRHTRMYPILTDRKLLTTGDGEALVSETAVVASWYGRSRLILIENGSWLLNLPLVNHEHRKLAGRLVDSIGPSSQRVVFLESDAGGPPISDRDPSLDPPTGFALFGVWPIGVLLTQLALLGIVYACAQWPIHGVPDAGGRPSLTNFRAHISALGELLRETRDRDFATATLSRYREILQGDSDRPNARAAQSVPQPTTNPIDSV